jgi:hypothetical protein
MKPMAQIKWHDRWYQNIPEVLKRTETYFGDIGKDPYRVAAKQVMVERKWKDVDPNVLIQALRELNYLYLPSKCEPGPMFLFPEYDLEGVPMRAQTKPLYELLPNSKYVTLGISQTEFMGPVWLGNQDSELQKILDMKFVVVCEGPFDLLALRVAAPEIPSLSSLTKNLSEDHIDYLRMLGVNRIFLMYDNEKTKAGERSMVALTKQFGDLVPIKTLLCPAGDPSECLENPIKTKALRSILSDLM